MAKTSRNANIELLRIISMVMVTMLHALGKSDLLQHITPDLPFNGWIAWLFESFSVGAVSIFMLITGYFLTDSKFRMPRLIELVLQVFFYTFVVFLVFLFMGALSSEDTSVYGILQFIFPVHMDVFWFVTAYLVLYIMLPLISSGIKGITQKQHGLIIILLLIYECFFKSLLPVRVNVDDKGYSLLWYLTVALIGSYFKLYGFKFLTNVSRGFAAYAVGSVLIYAELIVVHLINNSTGRLDSMLDVSTEYNHIFNLLASMGLFAALVHASPIKGKVAEIICKIAPFSLGVYLFQESPLLRYRWQGWFRLDRAMSDPVSLFVFRLFAAVFTMFVLGIVVDVIRSLIFKGIKSLAGGKDKN